jgi:hypothetical protein
MLMPRVIEEMRKNGARELWMLGGENQFAAEIRLLTSAATYFIRAKRPVFAYFQQ